MKRGGKEMLATTRPNPALVRSIRGARCHSERHLRHVSAYRGASLLSAHTDDGHHAHRRGRLRPRPARVHAPRPRARAPLARPATPFRSAARSSRRGALVICNFDPAGGDLSFTAPEGAAAGAIVIGARAFFIGLAKAGIGRNVDKYLAKCREYGIAVDDLYHVEDQPGDAWYLIGDWKPAKAGDPKHSDTTLVGILSTRAKTHELMVECLERGVDVSDVATAEYFPDFIKNEKKRYVEVKARLDAATR